MPRQIKGLAYADDAPSNGQGTAFGKKISRSCPSSTKSHPEKRAGTPCGNGQEGGRDDQPR